MIYSKRKNYEDTKKTTGCQGFMGREGELGGAQRIFRAVKLFCYVL